MQAAAIKIGDAVEVVMEDSKYGDHKGTRGMFGTERDFVLCTLLKVLGPPPSWFSTLQYKIASQKTNAIAAVSPRHVLQSSKLPFCVVHEFRAGAGPCSI